VAALIGIGAICSVVLIIVGLVRRVLRHQPVDSGHTMELVFDAIQLGAALSVSAYPIGYLLWSMSRKGGLIEENLPPGVGQDVILGVLVIGGAATLVYTVFNYRKHL